MAWEVGHRLQRDGTSQPERLSQALVPENNPIDDRREEDLLLFLHRIADQFAYYNARNEVEGDWRAFFRELEDENGNATLDSIRAFLQRARQQHDNPAFMTILLTFLKLFRHLQDDINKLTKEHLEFYFEKVLDFRRLPPRPDEVHVLFELAPHVQQHRIPAGTALKAGKDALGRPLTYVTNREIVANQAQLAQIKTVLVNDDGIYAAEVANSADGLGAPLEGNPPKWATFGDPFQMQRSTVGFAIASPLLLLREGQRKIIITLTFNNASEIEESAFQRFVAHASGEEEWVDLKIESVEKSDNQAVFTLIAGPETPAIVAYNPEMLKGNLSTSFPILRLQLHPQYPPYKELRDLKLTSIDLTVEVVADKHQPGVQDLVLQNDFGRQSPGSAFQPFGALPAKGSRFYIGSREVFSKSLENLAIQVEWANLPEDNAGFADYYDVGSVDVGDPPAYDYRYPGPYRSNGAFTVTVDVLEGGKWHWLGSNKPLFNDQGILQPQHIIPIGQIDLPVKTTLPELEAYNPTAHQGFIRLTLERDFGHRIYPKLFAELSVDQTVTQKEFPNAPYTPTIQSISLGYKAAQRIAPDSADGQGQYFHILPFGSEEQGRRHDLFWLPQISTAALYLGLEGLAPPQNLHLLFQIAEGSAALDEIIVDEDIIWNYLTANGWRAEPLSGSELFINTTQGLQKSGILGLRIGKDASEENTLMPCGYYWLRAEMDRGPAAAASTVAIHTQVVTAVFKDQNNDPHHLSTPLPAGSITGMLNRERAIRSVKQPYVSFGGAPEEQAQAYYARVSERLRHKQRAITLWDIERLVLHQFPQLYEVKVIPHAGLDDDGYYSEFCPGQLTVVIIPALRNQNAVNPLQPMASNALREAVYRYLMPLVVHIIGERGGGLNVINPRYEPIQVSCSVGFQEGYDPGFYAEALDKALQRFLSPWAFEEGPDIQFRNRIYRSQILAYVEELPYVDYVTDFEIRQGNAGPGIEEMGVEVDFIVRDNEYGMEVDVAEASSSASILVSKEDHLIRVLFQGDYPCN